MRQETAGLVARAADDDETAVVAVQGRLDAGDAVLMAAAVEFMRDQNKDPELRGTLLDVTASTETFRQDNLGVAREFLASADHELQFAALAVLERFPEPPRELVRSLVSSSDPHVRQAAREILGALD